MAHTLIGVLLLLELGIMCFSAAALRPVAIITGGTRGIGSGIASALADAGYDLILSYNSNEEAARKFALSLPDHCLVECIGGDISLVETRDKIFECFDKMFHGRPLKVMVHNAGQYVGVTSSNADGLTGDKTQIFGDGSLSNDDGSTNFDTMHYYQRMYGEAFIDLCERSLARMKENSGSLIGISSPGVNPALYAAAELYCMPGTGKSLMEYSMRIYAKKAAERRINVNIIVPGVVKTGAWTKLAEKRGLHDADELIEGFLKTVPMNRALVPRDIGDVVAFLCSEGGKFITGVILPVDGGIHLRR